MSLSGKRKGQSALCCLLPAPHSPNSEVPRSLLHAPRSKLLHQRSAVGDQKSEVSAKPLFALTVWRFALPLPALASYPFALGPAPATFRNSSSYRVTATCFE